jgi:hypothetical protein
MTPTKNKRTTVGIAAGVVAGLAGVLLFARMPAPAPVTLESMANNARGPGIPPAPGSSQNAPPNPNPGASTANLKMVANALHLDYKSVTVVVTLPPGLGVSNRVDVSVSFDERGQHAQRITQAYSNSNGNRIIADLDPGDGQKRRAEVVISLAEANGNGDGYAAVYAVRSTVDVQPLYDVTLGPLSLYLVNNCDEIRDSEPHVYFKTPSGEKDDVELSMSGGETESIAKFARQYREVSLATNLRVPVFRFLEEDVPMLGFYSRNIAESGPPLLPGVTKTVAFDMTAANDNFCAAKFRYRITYTLLKYPNL